MFTHVGGGDVGVGDAVYKFYGSVDVTLRVVGGGNFV